jgi:hypothetical protein
VVVEQRPEASKRLQCTLGPAGKISRFPATPPPRVWFGIAGWIGLISIGVIGTALIVAHQAIKQLKFLETMAEAVGGDGFLPRVPEQGFCRNQSHCLRPQHDGKACEMPWKAR